MLWIIALVGLVVACIAWSFKGRNELLDVRGRSVFISGCDTGFGNGLALRLDKLGLKVFAGCLTPEGVSNLKAVGSSQLEAFICDITKPEDIANATKIVAAGSPQGLWALVNNAGIGIGGEWDWFPEKHLRRVMEINFFAHVAVTKAFLPQIKKSKGRIINLASVAGFLAETGLGAYSCTKFAMEAFSDSLRREMRKWGISVFVIEPGFTATPMVLNVEAAVKRVWADVSEEHKTMYGEEYKQELMHPKLPPLDSPEMVLDVLQSKVINKYPTARSRVGRLALIAFVACLLPTSWGDAIMRLMFVPPVPAVLKKTA